MLLIKVLTLAATVIQTPDTGQLPPLHTLSDSVIASIVPLRDNQTITISFTDGKVAVYGPDDWDMEDTFPLLSDNIRAAIGKVRLVFTLAEVNPKFPGGDRAWDDYLRGFCERHREEIEKEGSEAITVRFEVHFHGQVTDVSVVGTPAHPGLAELAMKALRESPAWIPATQNHRIVECYKKQLVNLTP